MCIQNKIGSVTVCQQEAIKSGEKSPNIIKLLNVNGNFQEPGEISLSKTAL